MTHRSIGGSRGISRRVAALALGLVVAGCGGQGDLAAAGPGGALVADGASSPAVPDAPPPGIGTGTSAPIDVGAGLPGETPVAIPTEPASPAPTEPPAADPEPSPAPAPIVVAPAPAPTPAPAPAPAPTEPAPYAWTKPAGFDAALQAAISAQPSYMGGYGGQVANPFPRLPGTAWFPGMQITRVDAIAFGDHFGRPSYRFYADAQSRHSNGLRAEFTGASAWKFVSGDTYNYKFATYFPADYKNSTWTEWNLFAQFHGPGFPAWGLHTAGGYLHMKPPWAGANQLRIPMPARGQWHEFDWTIRWAPDGNGRATLLLDGVQVFDYTGATMHEGEDYYYPKFGNYLANNPYTQVIYTTPWVITRR